MFGSLTQTFLANIKSNKINVLTDNQILGLSTSKLQTTIERIIRATGMPEDCFCLAYYTGDYSIAPPEKIDKFCMEMK